MIDLSMVLAVLAAPLAVACAWFAIARRASPPALAIAGGVVAAATVEGALVVALGLARALTPAAVSISHLGVAVGAFVVLVRAREAPIGERTDPDRWAWFAVSLLLAVGGAMTWLALVMPTSNFDSLAYHLPMLAHWVQRAAVDDLPHLGIHRFYAYGFEVWSAPLAVVLRSEVAAALPNLAGWTLLGLGVYCLAQQAGARAMVAACAAIVVLTAPVTLGRLDAVQPDLWLGALFVVAASSFVHAQRTGARAPAVTAVLCLGLLAFLKTSGWVYAGILVVGALTAMGLERGHRASPRAWIRREVVAAAALASGLALFWTVRNLLWTGNPLGAFEVRVGGITLFDGVIGAEELRRTSVAGVFRLTERGDWITLRFMVVTMLGWPLLAWTALGALVAGVQAVRTPRRPDPRAVFLLILFVACVIAYLHMPYGGDNGDRGYRLTPWSAAAMRYAVPAWALTGVLGAVGLSRWARGGMLAALIASMALVVGCVSVLGLRLPDALALLLAASLVGGCAWRWLRTPARASAPVLVVLALAIAVVAARPVRERAWEEVYGPFFAAVERIVPDGAPIGYYVLTRPYPLVGRRMEHPLTSRPDPWTDRQRLRDDPQLWNDEVRRWLDRLAADGVHHLVVLSYNRFAHRDARGPAAHELLQTTPGWRLQIAPTPPMHLALWVWGEGDAP